MSLNSNRLESPGEDELNPIEVDTPMPKELIKALEKFGKTDIGNKVFSQFIKEGKTATFIEITKATDPEYRHTFQAFNEDNEITYTRDVKGYVKAHAKMRLPGDGLGSATLGSLVAHEFGHTDVGLAAIGQSSIPIRTRNDQRLEETRAAALFENPYRKHFGMPLRRTYQKENDVLNFDPTEY